MQKRERNHERNFEKEFATAPMAPLIFRMAMPAVAAQLVNLLYNIVDRIYIGHMAQGGVEALAGVGVCSTIITFVAASASIVGGGAVTLCSIAFGRKDYQKASLLFNNGLTLLLLFTVCLSLPAWIFMKPLLFAVGATSATYPYAHSYLSIYMTGTLFVMFTMGMSSFMNVQGRPGVSMCSVVLGAGLNIGLDPLFIYTLHMGVAGAALATVISQAASALFLLKFLASRDAALHFSLQDMRLRGRIVREIFSLGISPFIMGSTESLIGFVLNRALSHYGVIYVSTLTIMQSLMQLYATPLQGFGQGSTPIISYNYGAGNRSRMVSYFKVVLAVMFSVDLAFVLWELAMPEFFAGLFTDDEDLIHMVAAMMPYFSTGMALFGLQRACQNMFVGMNQAKISLFVALLRKVFLLVPLALILPHVAGLGVRGVYLAESIADGTAALLCTLIFAIRFPKILKSLTSAS